MAARAPMTEDSPPVAGHTRTHPETGELAHLVVRQVPGPGRQLWWSVELLGPGGTCPLAGMMAITWRKTRGEARQQLRAAQERALRTAGYTRDQAGPDGAADC